jgi:hypothetical protein
MQTKNALKDEIIAYYYPLLHRYARRLINNIAVSEILAKLVLEDQYKLDGLAPAADLRLLLKTDLYQRCFYWRQSNIFDAPPVAVPRYGASVTDNKKNHPIN